MRILIVEDSAVDSLIPRNILSHSGHAPTVVKSGEEALKELEAHPGIDLVLSDIFMPGMDGVQLLEPMRQDPCLAHVLLMFTSGASEAETVHRAAALRPDGYMLKPFTEPSRILARVEKAVQNAPVVMLDSNAIRSRTGLGSTGVKELPAGVTQEFTHVLEAATDPGHAVTRSPARSRGWPSPSEPSVFSRRWTMLPRSPGAWGVGSTASSGRCSTASRTGRPDRSRPTVG